MASVQQLPVEVRAFDERERLPASDKELKSVAAAEDDCLRLQHDGPVVDVVFDPTVDEDTPPVGTVVVCELSLVENAELVGTTALLLLAVVAAAAVVVCFEESSSTAAVRTTSFVVSSLPALMLAGVVPVADEDSGEDEPAVVLSSSDEI